MDDWPWTETGPQSRWTRRRWIFGLSEALQVGCEPAAEKRQGGVPRSVVHEAMAQQADELAGELRGEKSDGV